MRFITKHLYKILLITALFFLIAGIIMGEHDTLFSYAIVICLNCMGIG